MALLANSFFSKNKKMRKSVKLLQITLRGRIMARYNEDEEKEENRVVYYDLDAESHRRNMLLVPDAVAVPARPRLAVSALTKVAGEGSSYQVFPRQQQLPLFNLGG